MTSAERPDQIYGKGEPLDVNIDISRIKGAKVTMCRPDISEELPMPLGIDNPLVRQMLYSTKHLDAALDEAREHLPDRFKTNGELDIYNMVSALDVHQDPLEHAKRWQNDVRQLVNDWHCLPVRSERGDRLAREVMGMLNRRIASGSTGRSDRGLVSRMRSTLTMGKIANELIAVAAELGNGDSAAIMTESGQHCVFFLANPEGSFVGLCEMTEKLPTFIDGVPDYLYYAVISAIGWRGMKTIPHHLEGIIRKAMTFGGFGKDVFTQLEVVHHPEFVTKMPQHYAIGEISMDEVMRGVASPNTRPILIK